MSSNDVKKVISELQNTDVAVLKDTIVSVNYVVITKECFEKMVRDSRKTEV